MQRPQDVLASVSAAEVGNGQLAGLAADVVAAGRVLGAMSVGVVERAHETGFKVDDQVLELAHNPCQGRRRVGVPGLHGAGDRVRLQSGH